MSETIPPPPYLSFNRETRRLGLDPREPRFHQDPYEAYRWLHVQDGVFFWEEFGLWCVGRFDQVNALLRDRTFGRQNPAGIPDSRSIDHDRTHLTAFDAVEAIVKAERVRRERRHGMFDFVRELLAEEPKL